MQGSQSTSIYIGGKIQPHGTTTFATRTEIQAPNCAVHDVRIETLSNLTTRNIIFVLAYGQTNELQLSNCVVLSNVSIEASMHSHNPSAGEDC